LKMYCGDQPYEPFPELNGDYRLPDPAPPNLRAENFGSIRRAKGGSIVFWLLVERPVLRLSYPGCRDRCLEAAMKIRTVMLAAAMLAAMAGTAVAGPFEDAVAAQERADYATALRLLRPLADQGNAGAQNSLGTMYENGHGVPQDYAEAVKWYRLAADRGDPYAQNNLGAMYKSGQGVPQNYAEAARWFRLAADQGLAGGQLNLGGMYRSGHGVPQNDIEAVKWYRLSAVQGDAFAQVNLAGMYETGRGVPEDHAEAVKWYRLAADQGDPFGQFQLGVKYATGRGVSKNDSEAVKWYRLAADGVTNLRRITSGSCTRPAVAFRRMMSLHTCGSACRLRRAGKLRQKGETQSCSA
jgi:uncharacterized protein